MRIFTICSAAGGAEIAVVGDGAIVARARILLELGLPAALPAVAAAVLAQAGGPLDAIAVVVGPGSFTGLRAGISVAAGMALALDVPVLGVTVAEALAAGVAEPDGRVLWTALQARRGRVFIDRGGGFGGWATDALPAASGRIAICGNAANLVAAGLAARGADVMLIAAKEPQPQDVAAVALRRLAGHLPGLPAEPLYVDAPEARPAPVRALPS